MKYDLKALSRQWFEEVWNNRNEAAIDRLASPDVVVHGLSENAEPARGTALFRQFWRGFLSAFPDLKAKVEDVLLEGDKTAVRLSFTGTHTGQGIGVEPTRRPFRTTAIVIVRWRDGKIIESWNEFDAAGMMRQLQAPDSRLRA